MAHENKAAQCVLTVALVAGVLLPNVARSYEISTHRELALQSCLLSSPSNFFSPISYDNIHNTSLLEGPGKVPFPFASPTRETLTPVFWVAEGADREDDYFDEQDAAALRFQNHFYNPVSGEGLSLVFPLFGKRIMGLPSPTWALADLTDPPKQDFSWKDAYEYLLLAYTAPTLTDREENWAKVFRSLGHVVHLIQDGAQPQHVRNDSHGGLFPKKVFGDKSAYEHFIASARRGEDFSSYPVVFEVGDPAGLSSAFADARHFFETAEPLHDGRGMVQFANREFVSAGTNFRGTAAAMTTAPGLTLPSATETSIVSISIQVLAATLRVPTPLTGTIDMVTSTVTDELTGEVFPNRFTSSYSIYDPDLEQAGQPRRFNLNSFNYVDASDLLLPRAVGYGAGILNYFFRVKLTPLIPPAQHVLRLGNVGDSHVSGELTIYLDSPRVPAGSARMISLPPGGSVDIAPGVPGPVDLVYVFEGVTNEGNEVHPAVSARSFDIGGLTE